MHRRPSGVTFSAVVLGVFDLFLFFGTVFYLCVAVLVAHSPGFPPSAPGKPAPPPHLMTDLFLIVGLMALICAAWGFSTFIGLMRMRSWARISVMIIGGCLAVFSLFELFGCIVVQISMKNFVPPPNFSSSATLVATNPDAIQTVFFVTEAFCAVILAIGIWWLVYFSLRRTRVAFELAPQPTLTGTAQLNPTAPITDFSVAQPVARKQAPAELSQTEVASVARPRPISMTVVAVLMLMASLSLLICCLMPFPFFFFGVQVSGWSANVILVSLAALYAAAGFGLLRMMHFGWLLAVGVQILGLLNLLTLLSPAVHARWISYIRNMTVTLTPSTPDAAKIYSQLMQKTVMSEMLVSGLVLGVAFALVMLGLLWRARWAYKSVK